MLTVKVKFRFDGFTKPSHATYIRNKGFESIAWHMQPTDSKRISNRVRRLTQQRALAQGTNLTYKSSVSNACAAAGLELLPIELWPTQRAWRYFYVTPEFQKWRETQLPVLCPAEPYGELRVLEQFEKERFSFSYGHPLFIDDELKRLKPIDKCVWELKTDDLRILGWFPDKDYFVAHIGELKEKLKKFEDYEPYIEAIVTYRSALVGSLPDHVYGGFPDVVSDRAR